MAFQSKPVLVGPDELLARLMMGRHEPQNLTLGKQGPNVQRQGWLAIEGGRDADIGQVEFADLYLRFWSKQPGFGQG